jgi:hypothetical protein
MTVPTLPPFLLQLVRLWLWCFCDINRSDAGFHLVSVYTRENAAQCPPFYSFHLSDIIGFRHGWLGLVSCRALGDSEWPVSAFCYSFLWIGMNHVITNNLDDDHSGESNWLSSIEKQGVAERELSTWQLGLSRSKSLAAVQDSC